ncbi:MAG TPA: DinB family protein [Candidatus Limnocylindria bacterium]
MDDERSTLTRSLQNVRRDVRATCAGLSDADANVTPLPTSPAMCVVGILSHLRWAEAFWIDVMFLGGPNRWPGSDRDSEMQMRAGHGRPLAELLDEYLAQTAHTDEVLAAHDLDAEAVGRDEDTGGPISLRTIVMRLIEETAHHSGHLDILRELADGVTGG